MRYAEEKFKAEKKEKSIFGMIKKGHFKEGLSHMVKKVTGDEHEGGEHKTHHNEEQMHEGPQGRRMSRADSTMMKSQVGVPTPTPQPQGPGIGQIREKKRSSLMLGLNGARRFHHEHYAQEDQGVIFNKKRIKDRRLSVHFDDDLESVEAKVNWFRREIFDRKFTNLSMATKKLLKAHYDELIAKRSKYREKNQKKAELCRRLSKGQKKLKGFGPWDLLWEFKAETIHRESPYAQFPSYRVRQIIVKGGDDLRQEIIAMQLIRKLQAIFRSEANSLYLRTYEIVVITSSSGIIEFIPDTISLDGLKKKYPGLSLIEIYKLLFGFNFEEAQKNFVESLAAYSLVMYLLQVKDR